MKDSRLHNELQSFPKNHKINEKKRSNISIRINKELEMSQAKFKRGIPFNRKIIATTLLTLTMAAILNWSNGGQYKDFQKLAGTHSEKVLTIENKENVSNQEEISPENVYSVSQGQNIWALDPREPRNLILEGTSIVHLQVINTSREAEILPKYENFYTYRPFTPLEVEIEETIYGKALSGKKTIYIGGGDIRISNLLDSWVGNEYSGLEKMGLTKLSREEQETKFISYTSEHDYNMEPGKEYAVILTREQTDDEIFIVMAQGYGIFEIVKTEDGAKLYKNVITGETSDLDF
ncbi:hypothetical protein [Bacillus sp. CHD6a]|uniref:hypothetical protein n=1 Tax=Bacillus sp. CHD6a TaxID=1643452 RepID=UPI0006CD5E26|nr:hypothetical protein [Bacillus sp. CHD6a]KPB05177.1 hypothetical protein AAV98_07430 [Bacillus sp. CHD6a]